MHADKLLQERRKRQVARSFPLVVLGLAPVLGTACGYRADGQPEQIGAISQAVSDCSYSIATNVHGVSKNGFNVGVDVTNVAGDVSTGFTVLVSAGAATLTHVANGDFQTNTYGYLLTPNASIASSQLNQGQTYHFELNFSGPYTQFNALMNSNNGTSCDQTPPTIDLTASGNFFTSNGTLTLSAPASDDVAVGQVVFTQDDVQIGQALTPPYTLAVPITSAVNGRHVYAAKALDLAGNSATQSVRVLVAIDDKFFGSETSSDVDYTNFLSYFDQITPGNAGKWGSVEKVQGTFDWTELDKAYNFAQANHIPFKFHNLIWGSQQPAWITGLSTADQLAAIDDWFAHVAAHYSKIDMIDVVNEPLHSPPPYAAALGGDGATGWDWVITAYQMARKYFPNSELLINDYSTLTLASNTTAYLKVINLLNAQGLVDGIGEQGHFYEKSPDLATLQTNLNSLAATGLPIYISELDLNLADDAQQAVRMSQIFPIFWSTPSVVGVTHWGYLQGNTWKDNTYLVRTDGSLRPSLTWLQCYMAGRTDCTVPPYVPQPHSGTASGITLQAPDYDTADNLVVAGSVVAYTSSGTWLEYNQVAFNSAWNTLNVTYVNGNSSTVNLNVMLGGLSSAVVATVPLPPTGTWGGAAKTVSIPWAPTSSTQDLYFQLSGAANLQTFQFAAPPPPVRNVVANGTFDSGASGWYSWSNGVVSATTARAHSGTQSLLVTNRASNAPAATNITAAVKPGQIYPYSLWVSINSADGNAQNINVTLSTQCVGGGTNYAQIGAAKSVPSANTWTRFYGLASIPNCSLQTIQLYVEGGTADLYVDDVQVFDTSGGANLTPDGTFETGTASGWSTFGSALSVTSTVAHSGTYSALTSGNGAAIQRNIQPLVTGGKLYLATGWVSVGSDVTNGSEQVKWQSAKSCDGASTTYPFYAGPTVTSGQWVQVTGLIDLTACTTVNSLSLYAQEASTGSLYLDDVSLIALP
jgi:GH35 family endo-1,4-beta-xylanase